MWHSHGFTVTARKQLNTTECNLQPQGGYTGEEEIKDMKRDRWKGERETGFEVNPWSKLLSQKPLITQVVKKSAHFMERECLLPCSHDPATVNTPSQLNPIHILIPYFFKANFIVMLPSMARSISQTVSSLRISCLNFCMHLSTSSVRKEERVMKMMSTREGTEGWKARDGEWGRGKVYEKWRKEYETVEDKYVHEEHGRDKETIKKLPLFWDHHSAKRDSWKGWQHSAYRRMSPVVTMA